MASDLQGVSTDLATTQNAENQAAGGLQDTTGLGNLAATAGEPLTTMGNRSLEDGSVPAINDANASRNIHETANQNDGFGTVALAADGATGAQVAEGTSGTPAAAGESDAGTGGAEKSSNPCGDGDKGDAGTTATATGTTTGTKTNNDTGAAGNAGLIKAASGGGEAEAEST